MISGDFSGYHDQKAEKSKLTAEQMLSKPGRSPADLPPRDFLIDTRF